MNSALYAGSVRHRRRTPVVNAFAYSLYMLYIDLSELSTVFKGCWPYSADGFNLVWFRRADYQTDAPSNQPLDEVIRNKVAAKTGRKPEGPVTLLTNLRHFGFSMNPVSFYFCFDRSGKNLEAIVAEINNTPWNEQHSYVLDCHKNEPRGGWHRFRFTKDFHVSPFIDMHQNYDWRFAVKKNQLLVHMENDPGTGCFFDVTMRLERREITPGSLRRALFQFPLMPLKVYGAIYWQAFKLWLKKCPSFTHPPQPIKTPDMRTP